MVSLRVQADKLRAQLHWSAAERAPAEGHVRCSRQPGESCHNLYPAPGLACHTPRDDEIAAGPPRSAIMLTLARCTTGLRPAAGKAARSRYADNRRAKDSAAAAAMRTHHPGLQAPSWCAQPLQACVFMRYYDAVRCWPMSAHVRQIMQLRTAAALRRRLRSVVLGSCV